MRGTEFLESAGQKDQLILMGGNDGIGASSTRYEIGTRRRRTIRYEPRRLVSVQNIHKN